VYVFRNLTRILIIMHTPYFIDEQQKSHKHHSIFLWSNWNAQQIKEKLVNLAQHYQKNVVH
jgi:hypothetical protein